MPAPCMYAHKIAELFMNIGAAENRKGRPAIIKVDSNMNEYLHYL